MALLDNSIYMVRRRFFSFLGRKFDIFDPDGNKIAYIHQKAFKLKEDIRIYTDDTKSEEIVTIKAQNVIDFSAAYDVVTPKDGKVWGVWRRKGWDSLIRDTWKLQTASGTEMELLEDSTAMALIRRFLTNIIPQSYQLKQGEKVIAEFHQRFNPFIFKLDVRIMATEAQEIAPLVAAAAALLCTIEGRQG